MSKKAVKVPKEYIEAMKLLRKNQLREWQNKKEYEGLEVLDLV